MRIGDVGGVFSTDWWSRPLTNPQISMKEPRSKHNWPAYQFLLVPGGPVGRKVISFGLK